MCVFCKIANKEIPSYTLYEDADFLAFLDISQTTPGHTLVIPKKHVPNLLNLDDEVSSNIFTITAKLAKKMAIQLETANFNIINNCGALAGQTVEHFHLHIVPRYPHDTLKLELESNQVSSEEMKKIQKRILGN